MKLVLTFVLVCAIGVGIMAIRLVHVWQAEQSVPAVVGADSVAVALNADEPRRLTAVDNHQLRASADVGQGVDSARAELGQHPGNAADGAHVADSAARAADSPEAAHVADGVRMSAPAPLAPGEPEMLPLASSDQANVVTASSAVHWASADGSPAVLRRLATARQALATDPHHPTALRDELAALRALGRWDEADQALKRLVEAEPHNLEVKLEYARQLVRQGLWNQAIDPLRQIVERQPDNLVAWSLLAAAHQTNGHLEAARQSWTRVIELAPADAAAYSNRGHVHESLGNWPAAAADFERSCELDPAQPDTALALSQVYSQLGRCADAKNSAQAVLQRNPRNVRAMNRLAELAWQASRTDPAGGQPALREAQDWWRKSLAVDPDQPAIRARLDGATQGQPN